MACIKAEFNTLTDIMKTGPIQITIGISLGAVIPNMPKALADKLLRHI